MPNNAPDKSNQNPESSVDDQIIEHIGEEPLPKKQNHRIVSVFGIGFIPFAPGTFGSLVGIPLAIILYEIGGWHAMLLGTLLITLIGYFATVLALKKSVDQDPSFIVIDEVAGQLLTFILPLALFPEFLWLPHLYVAGFVLFRIFDILKPWHVGWADEYLEGATGVMADDIVAGLYATLILTVTCFIYTLLV